MDIKRVDLNKMLTKQPNTCDSQIHLKISMLLAIMILDNDRPRDHVRLFLLGGGEEGSTSNLTPVDGCT